MRRIIFVSVILSLVSFAHAAIEESCCFCIADPSDKSTTAECQRWIKDNKKSLECTRKEIIRSHDDVSFEPGLSCRKVSAYGANHGLSYFYTTVFQFATKAAKNLSPVELSYDGSTCLVFNNVDIVEKEALKLSNQYPDVNFHLAGNQNVGVVRYLQIFGIGSKPKEMVGMSSKMIVRAQGGMVEVDYADCSRPKGRCSVTNYDIGATTDSNTKFCRDGNEIVNQKCCPPAKGSFGKWSIPGMECES
jgi:hypothetical protein